MKALRSELLKKVPGLIHGFGSRQEPIPSELKLAWEQRKPAWKQVHGVHAVKVTAANATCGDTDALWTRERDTPIAVVSADCVPILLARKDGSAAAAVHAGWRGTRGHILSMLWNQLSAEGENPSDWIAAVGPAIGPCCYEVSEELAADFKTEFSSYGRDLAVPRHRILDLPAINAEELRRIGVSRVDLIRHCTRCSGEDFHSYRREGSGTRQYSMLVLK